MSTTNASDDEMEWEEVVPQADLAPGDVLVEIQMDDEPASGKPAVGTKGRKLDEA